MLLLVTCNTPKYMICNLVCPPKKSKKSNYKKTNILLTNQPTVC